MDEQQNNLEEKIGFFGRMKYVAIPAIITAGAYFAPEIKKKYDSLPKEKQRKYVNRSLWASEVAGFSIVTFAAAKLYKNYILECMDKND